MQYYLYQNQRFKSIYAKKYILAANFGVGLFLRKRIIC